MDEYPTGYLVLSGSFYFIIHRQSLTCRGRRMEIAGRRSLSRR